MEFLLSNFQQPVAKGRYKVFSLFLSLFFWFVVGSTEFRANEKVLFFFNQR